MNKVLYFTNIFPKYRKNIWDKLLNQKEFDLKIFFDNRPLNGIYSQSPDELPHHKHKLLDLKNYSAFGVIYWQSKVIKECILSSFDKVIFLGEMNIISTWIACLVCKLKNKEIIFWTHGLYGNEGKIKSWFRGLFYKLADKFFIYENSAKDKMVKKGFEREIIHVIYNSLDFELQLQIFNQLEKKNQSTKLKLFRNNLPILFFIGRLTSKKKIDQLIQASILLNKINPSFNLLIIGSGPAQKKLEKLAYPILKEGLCYFHEAVFDEIKIAELIYNSDLCVSPGNVGLTAIHSMSYGIPVATHDNFKNQMPEAEAIEPFENGIFFNEDDIEDIAFKIKLWFSKYHGIKSKKELRSKIDKIYNPNRQIEVFKKVLD